MTRPDRWSLVVLCLGACAYGPAPQRPTPTSTPARSTGWVAPTRNEEECREVVQAYLASPDSFHATVPQATKIVFPPLDGVPSGQRGATVMIAPLVDVHGAVVADSITITPAITGRRYDRMLRDGVARTTFHPAVAQGCAVPARATMYVTLPRSTH